METSRLNKMSLSKTSHATEKTPLIKRQPAAAASSAYGEVRVYWQRWLVLGVYCSHVAVNNWLWFLYSAVPSVMTCYYSVDLFFVNALSWVFMLVYLLGVFPATYVLERFDLRFIAVTGGLLNALGAWLRFAGSYPQQFWLVFAGSVVASVTNLLEWSACSLLSSVWFPASERAIATAGTAAIAPQLGALVGLLAGPLIIYSPDTEEACNGSRTANETFDYGSPYNQWQEEIFSNLFYYQLTPAIIATVLLPVTFMMPASPPTPPSLAQTKKTSSKNVTFVAFLRSILAEMRNGYFLFFLAVFGVFVGANNSFITVYAQILLGSGYQNYSQELGYLGLGIQVAAILALLLVGKFLDFTRTFFFSTIMTCSITTVLTTLFAMAVQIRLDFGIVCALAIATGATIVMFQAIGYEYGVEMTYPMTEAMSAGLLNSSCQIFSIVQVVVVGLLVDFGHSRYSSWFFVGMFIPATVVMGCVQPSLRRVQLEEPRSGQVCWVTYYRPTKSGYSKIEDSKTNEEEKIVTSEVEDSATEFETESD